MRVVLATSAKDQLTRLERAIQKQIFKKLSYLESSSGATLKRMKGVPTLKIRVGDYRIIGFVQSNQYNVLYIGHRKDVYRQFD